MNNPKKKSTKKVNKMTKQEKIAAARNLLIEEQMKRKQACMNEIQEIIEKHGFSSLVVNNQIDLK